MTEVNEAERFRAQFARAVVTRAPIVYDRRIERRFVKLVLHKDAPIVRQRSINLAHAFKITFKSASKMLLARKVSAVSDPDRVGLRAKRLSDLNTFDVVGHGLLAHGLVWMRE